MRDSTEEDVNSIHRTTIKLVSIFPRSMKQTVSTKHLVTPPQYSTMLLSQPNTATKVAFCKLQAHCLPEPLGIASRTESEVQSPNNPFKDGHVECAYPVYQRYYH